MLKSMHGIAALVSLLFVLALPTGAELFTLRTEYQDPNEPTNIPDNLALHSAPYDYLNFQVISTGFKPSDFIQNFELVNGTLRWNGTSDCKAPSALYKLTRGDSVHGRRGLGKNVHLKFNETSGRLTFTKAKEVQGLDEASWTVCGGRKSGFYPVIGLLEHFPHKKNCRNIYIRKAKPTAACP